MILLDVNGYPHELTPHQARMMMTVGWLAFLLSWIMNILFYATHPSAVDLSPKRLKGKCSIHVLGKKIKFLGRRGGHISNKLFIAQFIFVSISGGNQSHQYEEAGSASEESRPLTGKGKDTSMTIWIFNCHKKMMIKLSQTRRKASINPQALR